MRLLLLVCRLINVIVTIRNVLIRLLNVVVAIGVDLAGDRSEGLCVSIIVDVVVLGDIYRSMTRLANIGYSSCSSSKLRNSQLLLLLLFILRELISLR